MTLSPLVPYRSRAFVSSERSLYGGVEVEVVFSGQAVKYTPAPRIDIVLQRFFDECAFAQTAIFVGSDQVGMGFEIGAQTRARYAGADGIIERKHPMMHTAGDDVRG